MYRRLSKRQQEDRARKLDAMKRGRERAALARPARGRMPDLPHLRRELIVIDYDTGAPVTHTLHLYRSDRVDCYNVAADGQPWKARIGWSKVLAGVRKAYQRLPGQRSDFWH